MPTLQKQVLIIARAQRVVLCVTAAALIAFYVFGYRPATARLAQLDSLVLSRQREIRSNQGKAAARNEIAARNEKLRAELDQIKKPSKQQELPEVIKELTVSGTQNSLKKFNYKPGAPAPSELFCEQPLVLTFEGDFVSVFNFLRNTEDMPRLTRVRSVSLKARDDKTGMVQAQVAVNFYFSMD